MEKNEYKHWCGVCQLREYYRRYYGINLTWVDCPYYCPYAEEMRKLIEMEEKV